MKTDLTIGISHLMERPTGTRESYTFDARIQFKDFKITSKIQGRAEIMRIEEGLNVRIEGVKTSAQLVCDHCLENFIQDILITQAERQFWLDPPQVVEDVNDLYLINKKSLTVDLSEMIRQEIILHFPLILVCSKSCKGLCSVCGNNKNHRDCQCEPADFQESKPLAALKELIK